MGETATLTASGAGSSTVTWTSGDTDIATVTSGGVVTGVAAGEVVITASAEISGETRTGTCTVTVEAPATSVWFAFTAEPENRVTQINPSPGQVSLIASIDPEPESYAGTAFNWGFEGTGLEDLGGGTLRNHSFGAKSTGGEGTITVTETKTGATGTLPYHIETS